MTIPQPAATPAATIAVYTRPILFTSFIFCSTVCDMCQIVNKCQLVMRRCQFRNMWFFVCVQRSVTHTFKMFVHIPLRVLFTMVEKRVCPPNSVFFAEVSDLTGIVSRHSVTLCPGKHEAGAIFRKTRIKNIRARSLKLTRNVLVWLAVTDGCGRTWLLSVTDMDPPLKTRKLGVQLKIVMPRGPSEKLLFSCALRIQTAYLVNLLEIEPTWQCVDHGLRFPGPWPMRVPTLYTTKAVWFTSLYLQYCQTLQQKL